MTKNEKNTISKLITKHSGPINKGCVCHSLFFEAVISSHEVFILRTVCDRLFSPRDNLEFEDNKSFMLHNFTIRGVRNLPLINEPFPTNILRWFSLSSGWQADTCRPGDEVCLVVENITGEQKLCKARLDGVTRTSEK